VFYHQPQTWFGLEDQPREKLFSVKIHFCGEKTKKALACGDKARVEDKSKFTLL
jgi:hypothetical protein